MQIFSNAYALDYAWDEVSTANWRKYCPWNKSSQHVIAVDVLSRHIDADTGILCTERLITCHQPAPAVVKTLLGGQCTTYSYEKSYVNPKTRNVTMLSSNLTWTNLISVREKVVYEPLAPSEAISTQQPEQTHFAQEARITAVCGGWQKMKTKIEDVTLERFRDNAERGHEGFESVLRMSHAVFRENAEKQALGPRDSH